MTIALIYDRNGYETDGMPGIIVVFFVIAVIVYLLYELITVRKWAAVKKAAKYTWVLFAVYAVIIGGILININIIKSHKPSAQDIDYINVLEYENKVGDDFLRALTKIDIGDEEIKKVVAETLAERIEDSTFANMGRYNNLKVRIVYNGKTIVRKMRVAVPQFTELLMQNEDVIKLYYEKVPSFENIERVSVAKKRLGSVDVNYDMTNRKLDFIEKLKADKQNMTPDEWVDCTKDYVKTSDGTHYYSVYLYCNKGDNGYGIVNINITEKNRHLLKNVCDYLEGPEEIIY